MKEFFYHYQRCASYSGTLNCPGLLLPRTRDTDLQFQDSPGHSGTVGHPKGGREEETESEKKRGREAIQTDGQRDANNSNNRPHLHRTAMWPKIPFSS